MKRRANGPKPAPMQTPATAADAVASRMVARVRWLMIISGFTTLVAIAAVIGVIGYRAFPHRRDQRCRPPTGSSCCRKARASSPAALADDRLAVTLDIGGATEIRTFDLKTLKQTGRIRFATEP